MGTWCTTTDSNKVGEGLQRWAPCRELEEGDRKGEAVSLEVTKGREAGPSGVSEGKVNGPYNREGDWVQRASSLSSNGV